MTFSSTSHIRSLSYRLKGILNEQGFLSGPPPNENARFGMAISAAPDLDLDGYSDVIVGAPLEDKGKGVIYIYNGERKTLNKQFSQVRRETFVLNTEKDVLDFFFVLVGPVHLKLNYFFVSFDENISFSSLN